MKKSVALILIFLSVFATVLINQSTQKNRGSFALCGTSYEANQSDADEPVTELKMNVSNIQMRNQMNMHLREIITDTSDPLNHVWLNLQVQRNHCISFYMLDEENKVDNLFLSSIFKPPKA